MLLVVRGRRRGAAGTDAIGAGPGRAQREGLCATFRAVVLELGERRVTVARPLAFTRFEPMRGFSLVNRADVESADSLSNRLRAARFRLFESLLPAGSARILDIGGTNAYWTQRGYAERTGIEVLLVNLAPEPQVAENLIPVVADASSLDYDDMEFDVVFSNSVIEHLVTRRAQHAMAREVRRLAPTYYVQTPNYWFPIEPHFLAPGWQYLPERVRVEALRRRRFGHLGPVPDPLQAFECVEEIKLLTSRELRLLFPDATIHRERFGPWTKSLTAVRRAV